MLRAAAGYATRIRSPMTPQDPLCPMAGLTLTRPSEAAYTN
jgi:hypothetical protein